MEISTKNLSNLLRLDMPKNASFVDKIKIAYRPYICPFSDLLEIIPEHSSVFDIGCGNGIFLSLTAGFRKPISLGGMEITQKLIDNARNILKNVQVPIFLNVFNGMDILQEIKNYQYIFLIDVIHHVSKNNQIKFLRNIRDEIAQGSILVIKDIDADHTILSKFNKLHDLVFSGKIGQELGLSTVKKILSDLGFKVMSVSYKRVLIYPHYTIVCQK